MRNRTGGRWDEKWKETRPRSKKVKMCEFFAYIICKCLLAIIWENLHVFFVVSVRTGVYALGCPRVRGRATVTLTRNNENKSPKNRRVLFVMHCCYLLYIYIYLFFCMYVYMCVFAAKGREHSLFYMSIPL